MNTITEALRELEERIATLTTARDALRAVEPTTVQTPRPPAAPPTAAKKTKRTYKKRGLPFLDVTKKGKGGGKANGAPPHPDPLPRAQGFPPKGGEGEEKPDTLAGAMKYLARRFKKPFSMQDLTEALKADPDFEPILLEANPGTLYANLAYWAKTGKIDKQGEGSEALFTVINLDF